mmetsp:Transcript_7043/g.8903  ORF Transcript_7043/g.8903 Transcript_7043/m.8903 type:complete len:105 (+) Transcript_7043:368-682(+)
MTLTFWHDTDTLPQLPVSQVLLQVSALSTGVRPSSYHIYQRKHSSKAEENQILFNIIMEPLILGVLPFGATKMVIWGIACIFLALLLVPQFMKVFNAIPSEKES